MFVTAASYGEVEMAQALIAAGAELEATGVSIPGGTALVDGVVVLTLEGGGEHPPLSGSHQRLRETREGSHTCFRSLARLPMGVL
ncbi:MAG TPA: hypothetical protein VMS74_07865 [Acidimicrobiia bacterium]|nr:hypothetical protein [Acidimicrobiia bacterium]